MPILLGHRGSPHAAPENTMESFHAAIAAGAAGFEFDVRRSKDGRLVIIHDARTRGVKSDARTRGLKSDPRTGGRKSVSRTPAASLGLPMLEDVLRTFHGDWLDIEMKVPGIERRVIELARRHLDPARYVITSFNAKSIREVKRLSPATPAGWLFKRTLLTLPKWTASLDYLCPHYSVLTKRLAKLAHARGLRIVTWTVNKPSTYKRVLPLADVIITNYPERYS